MDTSVEYKIYDADSHHHGLDDYFTRYIETAYGHRAVRVAKGEGKYARMAFLGGCGSLLLTALRA